MRIDAHCHTDCSDGNVTIEERIAMIRSSGLDAATITDHDFISKEQVALARRHCQEMPYIPGIELSLRHQNKVVHLLGYFIAGFSAIFPACRSMISPLPKSSPRIIGTDTAAISRWKI